MARRRPRVSIGMPVYNGERFIDEALESVLAQTYEDYELIISDNASTDGTRDICLAYARRDRRIRYFRNDTNLGAARNFNRVFELSRGEYFKWAAHDDVLAPEYLERCSAVLDRAPPFVVLCLPRTIVIDAEGKVRRELDFMGGAVAQSGCVSCREFRFRDVVRFSSGCVAQVAFGLMRRTVLRSTRLMGTYQAADFVLAVEMGLRGLFWQVPDHLFFLRIYGQHRQRRDRSWREEALWWDPGRDSPVILPPIVRLLSEQMTAINCSRLSVLRKAYCYVHLSGFLERRLWSWLVDTGWRLWAWLSVQALKMSRHTHLPVRVWALLRMTRRSDHRNVVRLLSSCRGVNNVDILCEALRALMDRSDTSGQSMIVAWLADPLEHRRIAAATVLGEHPDKYADVLCAQLKNERSEKVRGVLVTALARCVSAENADSLSEIPCERSALDRMRSDSLARHAVVCCGNSRLRKRSVEAIPVARSKSTSQSTRNPGRGCLGRVK